MATAKQDVNTFVIRGRIVNKYRRDPLLTLAISTISGGERRDYPRIYFFDPKLIQEIDEKYDVGSYVTVKGVIQTSRQYHSQSFVGSEISETPRVFEQDFGLKGKGRHMEDVNEIKLRGKFVRVFVPESSAGRVAIATLRVETDGHTNFPSVTCFGSAAERAAGIAPDTMVCFIGQAQTHKVSNSEGVKYYESAVGSIMPE